MSLPHEAAVRSHSEGSRTYLRSGIYDDEKKQVYTSAQYDIRITDRIGGGDAFASGLIYALHNNISPANAIETAAAAGCLDQTLEGDFCLFGINDVIDLAGGNSSGRVKR